jgi:type II secretory pathway component PulK
MKRRYTERGFALVTVLCVLMIVSGVALALAAGMRSQVRAVTNARGGLEAEQLCAAAQDMAVYLTSRGLGTSLENFEGLPVEVVQPALQYRIHFPNGDVKLYLDGEDGKLNLSTASPALLESFFATWSDDRTRGIQLAAAMKDWGDADDIAEPEGAEASAYSQLGYSPRNRGFGIADAPLLQGLTFEDFRERLVERQGEWVRKAALTHFLTNAPVGATINPGYAPELILRAVPGLSDAYIDRILVERRRGQFKDVADFSARAGIPGDAQALGFFHFSRKVPGVLVIARSRNGRVVRSERRVGEPFMIQFNVFPDYVPKLQAVSP